MQACEWCACVGLRLLMCAGGCDMWNVMSVEEAFGVSK
jgi:hypothetical protein